MNIKKNFILLFIIVFLLRLSLSSQAQTTTNTSPRLGRNTLKEIIANMTLREKATLVVGVGDQGDDIVTKVPGAAGSTAAIPRLGIPSMVLSDGPAGVRIHSIRNSDKTKTYYATAFPVGTLLASTWDPLLVKKVGEAFGSEVKEYGIDVLLAPGVNIHRNPLNGRNFEYYSEDPLIAGTMAGAIINGIQSNGVGTSIKHFAANNQESNRHSVNAIISERALRELYLKSFRIAIAASSPWTVMSSYNQINGTFTAESHDLLTTILRDEWNFKGFVMTDWGAGRDWTAMMKAGNDLITPGSPGQIDELISAVEQGKLNEKVLDVNVERILKIILKSPVFKNYAYTNKPDLESHAKLSRLAASEGMVLLKNENKALPLNANIKKIALFGNASYKTLAGGTGSGEVNTAYVVSLAKGIENAGYQADRELSNIYKQYLEEKNDDGKFKHSESEELVVSDDEISQKAIKCDIALITISRNAGEGIDRKVENDYKLTANEKQQIRKITEDFHSKGKKAVVILNIGGVIDMKGCNDEADAILLAWQPGQEAGNAITDVLSGKVNPSGKLASTFAENYADVPSAKNFPGTPAKKPKYVIYEEGIYVGYRYYDKFNIKPRYEFGYGLSYTDFTVSKLTLSPAKFNGNITATVVVKNTGKVPGKQVVQIYISAPSQSIDKPLQELKAFGKTMLLLPGEKQTFTFTLKTTDLDSYHTDHSAWITDKGRYLLKVGFSSRDTRQTAGFDVPKTIVTEKGHDVLKPQITISELKNKNIAPTKSN